MVSLEILRLSEYRSNIFEGAFAVGKISDEERFDVVRHACPGAGACGGMYTANTMSSALEVSIL
jgi:dihydroxyacid dehydratase/phosphogluconate dehydratase